MDSVREGDWNSNTLLSWEYTWVYLKKANAVWIFYLTEAYDIIIMKSYLPI
jgi:hypothetical protein